jgi:hypothetical protein
MIVHNDILPRSSGGTEITTQTGLSGIHHEAQQLNENDELHPQRIIRKQIAG